MNEKIKDKTTGYILDSDSENSFSWLLAFILFVVSIFFLWLITMGVQSVSMFVRDSVPIKKGITDFFESELRDVTKVEKQNGPSELQNKIIDEATVHYQTGWDYYKNEEYLLSISEFEKVIDLIPSEARAYNNIGLSYHDMGERGKAIESWKKANEVDPAHHKSLNNIGAEYTDWFFTLQEKGTVDLEKLEMASSFLERSITVEPNYSFSRETYGRVNATFAIYSPDKKAEYERIAEENLKKAIELDYSRPEAHGFLAVLYFNQKVYIKSLSEFRAYEQLGGTGIYFLSFIDGLEEMLSSN